MRHILPLLVALNAVSLVACVAPASEDVGVIEGAATDDDNDGHTAGGFDVRGKLTPEETFSFHFKKDNVSVLAFDATPEAALDVAVITSTEGAQVHIDIHGPFNPSTGKFGPRIAQGEIEQHARVRDFKVPTAGIYMILASEVGNTEADYTAIVQPAGTPRVHASMTQDLFGPKIADEGQRRAAYDAVCADWKKRMFALSGDHIDFITCGTPKGGFGESKTLESTGTVIVSAKVGENGLTTSEVKEGAELSASGVDESPTTNWQNACFDRLNSLKTQSPTRFITGTCPRTVALGVRAGDVFVETWSGSVRGVFRQ